MNDTFWKLLEFMFDHWILSLATIIGGLYGLGLWIISSGGGMYLVYGLIVLYLIIGFADMVNRDQRNKYLREQENQKID